MAQLARCLGPWAAPVRPANVATHSVVVPSRAPDEREFLARVWQPTDRPAYGALLLVPGLHFSGPADPRLDLFAARLASSGQFVLSPFLPDYLNLMLDGRVQGDTQRAWQTLLSLPDRPRTRPSVFAISFGALPAMRLAADDASKGEIASLTMFGAYAEVDSSLRHTLYGAPGRPHDPLGRPVLFLNVLEHLPGCPEDPSALIRAWRRYVKATWYQPELKRDERFVPVAHAFSLEVPPEQRTLFLQGCGAAPGGQALFEEALARRGGAAPWLDPMNHVPQIQCPTTILHGATDDIIPYTHAQLLSDALPAHARAGVHITGLYGHAGLGNWSADPAFLVKEVRAMAGALWALRAR